MPEVYTKGQQRSIVTLINGCPLSINDGTILLSITLRLADVALLLLLWLSKTSKWVPACLEWILRLLLCLLLCLLLSSCSLHGYHSSLYCATRADEVEQLLMCSELLSSAKRSAWLLTDQ